MHVYSSTLKTLLKATGLVIAFSLNSVAAYGTDTCTSFYARSTEKRSERVMISDKVTTEIMRNLSLAKSEILIEMSNVAGHGVEDILIQKKKDGVVVRVILDNRHALKGGDRQKEFERSVANLRQNGIEVFVSENKHLSLFRKYPKSFLHRKIMIVDRRYTYVGSANLGINKNFEIGLFSEYTNVDELTALFNSDVDNITSKWTKAYLDVDKLDAKNGTILLGPGTKNPDTRSEILKLISGAQRRILLSSYEASDAKVLQKLIEKKKTNPNLEIKVILCSSKANIWLGRRLLKVTKSAVFKNKLLNSGIEVRELDIPEQYNHSRFIVSDDQTIGMSSDFTQRSFDGNIDLGFQSRETELVQSAVDGFNNLWNIGSSTSKATLTEYYYDKLIQLNEKVLSNWMRLKSKLPN